MNVKNALMRRKLGLTGRIEIDFAIDRIRLKEKTKLNTEQNPEVEELKTCGPLASTKLGTNVIAVANEDGYINLLNTNELKDVAHWLGHENAIFDIEATPDSKTLLTASGDTTIKRWDVETKKEITVITPHYSSIKSISVYDSNTIASGSRDGSIKIHDLRQKNPTVIVIRDAHRNRMIAKPRKVTAKTDPVSCVTNVAFDQYIPRVYSTGANDATIKLWDLRRFTKVNKPKRNIDGQLMVNQPNLEVHHPTKGMHCGYSHLLLSSCKVFAACSDNKIYCYDNFGSNEDPVKFTGYRYDTYLKLAVMDDRFLLSGAKGGGAIMWTLGSRFSPSMYYPETTKHPIGQLKADSNDSFDTNVIETDWDSLSIFTFRDDRLVCKWTMHHVLESERKKLLQDDTSSTYNDIAIEMSDIIDVNVLRLNHRVSNVQQRRN